MRLSQFFVQRPVFTIVFTFLLMIAGLLSFSGLALRHLPDINKAVVNISTEYEGASPELVEKEISIPIENALSGIPGIDSINSTSKLGKSYITVDFQLGTDVNEAVNDIRNKMSAIQRKLPLGSDAPSVRKNDANANPVMVLGFEDKQRSALDITDYVNRFIKPVIQEINGVGEVSYYGAREYAVKIAIDPVKMAARKITVSDIKKALTQQNIDIPSGQIQSKNRYYTVVTQARIDKAKHFADLVITRKNNHLIRLSEVAQVNIGNENEENLLRINGKPAIGLAVLAQSTANPVDVAQRIYETLKQLHSSFPKSFKASVVFDSTLYIKQSIYQVFKTFLEAVLFVALVVFLFLGDLRSALIPIVTIPICLVATFWPMQLLGFDLNTLTLLAMVLAIGLVVDDAIVVLENCHRHMQQGKSAIKAAIEGSQEITFAIIAMTITLAAVYAPMGFVDGFTGKLFLQFGVSLSLAVLISGLVALTLSPMMCAKLLKSHKNRYTSWLDNFFNRLAHWYQISLQYVLKQKLFFSLLILVCLLTGVYCYQHIKAELAPLEDQSYIIAPISSPTNSSTAYTDKYARELESIYDAVAEKQTYLMSVRPSGAFSLLKLVPWEKRQRSQQQISQDLNKKMEQLTGVSVFPVTPHPLGRNSNNSRFSFALLGHTSYKRLNLISNDVIKALNHIPELRQIKNNLVLDSEQINIDINRQLAADLQVNLADVAELLSTTLGGSNPVNFNYDGQAYKVIVQLDQSLRQDVSILNSLYVQSERKEMIPLSALIQMNTSIGPDALPHLNRMRTATITAELTENAHMDKVIAKVEHVLQQQLPSDIQYRFTDGVKDYLESSGHSLYAFALALLFIYLVLAAQFESFIDPFIVLTTVPLCLIGALFTLWLFNGSLNIYTNIGMVTLIGLISKHGIMITEFANQLKQQGKDKLSATVESATIRLRPILMTTSAMILGAIPLILATGAGSESREQLGFVIIGGLVVGTFFSLYLVPMMYLLFSRRKRQTESTEAQIIQNQDISVDTP